MGSAGDMPQPDTRLGNYECHERNDIGFGEFNQNGRAGHWRNGEESRG